jgi:hypothetical protein
LLASLALAGTLGSANADSSSEQATGVHLDAHLNPLNHSRTRGDAEVVVNGLRAHVDLDAYGLAPSLPHAEHIHFGAEARQECPSVFDDTNGDFRLTTSEGLPAYGPIVASLTTRGDTSPASALAVGHFPTAPNGVIDYNRTINFSSAAVARAIKNGNGVIVSTASTTTTTACTTSPVPARATSTPACQPRPPTPPCAECSARPNHSCGGPRVPLGACRGSVTGGGADRSERALLGRPAPGR